MIFSEGEDSVQISCGTLTWEQLKVAVQNNRAILQLLIVVISFELRFDER